MPRSGPVLPADVVAIGLLVLLAVGMVLTVRYTSAPLEDAAMLMRYAENLAAGHGLVWNVGEPPVDGATDVLFTVVVAGVVAAGMPVEAAARAVALVGWLVTVAVVYRTARDVHRANVRVAFLAAAAIIVGTATLYVSAGFGTPFFGMWTALLIRAAFRLRSDPSARWGGIGFGLTWLLLGLTRPEGVILGALVLGALAVDVGVRRSWRILGQAGAVMVVLGGAYFAWRWSYFGHPLPNPFYKKGGSSLHVDGLVVALRSLVMFGAPFAVVWVTATCDRRTRRLAVCTAAPVVGFTVIWILLSSEMNYAGRFQYAVAIMIAMSWPALLPNRPMDALLCVAPRGIRSAALGGLVVAALAPTAFYLDRSAATGDAVDGRAAVGDLLATYADRGHLVATSEAGLIPLRSGWRALDLWGLNDQTIAHRGHLTFDDLDRAAPTVVFTHAPQAPGERPVADPVLGQRWTDMTVTAADWAADRGYTLVRSAGWPAGSTWNIWVRPGTVDSEELRALLVCAYPELPSRATLSGGDDSRC